MSQISLDNVSKRFGSDFALSDVNLTIEDRSTTAIVGPSGSGKSTILRLMNGMERPDAGVVSVFGAPINYKRLAALRRRLGYAVQGTGLFPHMRVWENITLLARLDRWSQSRLEARARQLMELVDLPEALRSRYPHELSGGQQQRVGLCRAMMLNPPVFLLDEPFAAVDPITREEIHSEFEKLQQTEPRTIVLVTHDLREAFKLAQRIVIIRDGAVVQDDTRDAVLARPADAWVRELLQTQLDVQ